MACAFETRDMFFSWLCKRYFNVMLFPPLQLYLYVRSHRCKRLQTVDGTVVVSLQGDEQLNGGHGFGWTDTATPR